MSGSKIEVFQYRGFISIWIAAFCQRILSIIRKIMTVILLYLRVQLAKCTPYQHLHCNISWDQHLPDELRSTKKLGLNILPKARTQTSWHLVGSELMVEWTRVLHCSTRKSQGYKILSNLKVQSKLIWQTVLSKRNNAPFIFLCNFIVFVKKCTSFVLTHFKNVPSLIIPNSAYF